MTVQEAIEWLKAWSATHINENENVREAVWSGIQALEEVEQYRALGTVEELKEAREKQVAKKPKYKTRCDKCGTYNSVWGKLANPKGHSVVYCWNCGQANELDWEEGGISDNN